VPCKELRLGLDANIGRRLSCNSVGINWVNSYWAFTRCDHRPDRSARQSGLLVRWSVYTFRLSARLVGPTQAVYDCSVKPVRPTGRADCSRISHICQSNQCSLPADWPPFFEI